MINRKMRKKMELTIRNDSRFKKLCEEIKEYTGKEPGHHFSPIAENLIVKILIEVYDCDIPKNAKGEPLDRALGDLIYIKNNLINIKSGKGKKNKGKNGLPNMCSMNKIVKAFILNDETIDSYTIIKFKIIDDKINLHVFDMFDVIEYLTWNSGTGQIMLSESKFYGNYKEETEETIKMSLHNKKLLISKMYDEGVEKHLMLRTDQLFLMSDELNVKLERKDDRIETINRLENHLKEIKINIMNGSDKIKTN